MAMFGSKKSKPSEGSELVLAYLEDAQRVRTAITVIDGKRREVSATIGAVLDDKFTLMTQGPLMADKGSEVNLLFMLDGIRFKAEARVQEAKPGSATLDLPPSISLAERRRKPRARLNAREAVTATALTGLFDGVGLNGTVENISEGGVCIRVDRAMDVKTQRKMHMGANILEVGQPFMLVKLSKIPKCPPLELAGTVAWIDASHGLVIGIAFEPGKEGLLGPVRSLVASRAGAIPAGVPPKTRRAAEQPSDEDEAPLHRPAPKKDPEPIPKAEEVAPAALVEAPDAVAVAVVAPPPEAPEPAPVDERSQALLRVKKRARGILLAMPLGPDREAVAAFLAEDGYGRVLCADTLTELLEHVERPGIHLVLVDGGVAELQGLALASLLQHRLGEEMPPVVLAEASVDAELVLGAQETGVAQILVKPYDLDLDFRRMIEAHLGLS
jgi:CheY-like chemotaxis protein